MGQGQGDRWHRLSTWATSHSTTELGDTVGSHIPQVTDAAWAACGQVRCASRTLGFSGPDTVLEEEIPLCLFLTSLTRSPCFLPSHDSQRGHDWPCSNPSGMPVWLLITPATQPSLCPRLLRVATSAPSPFSLCSRHALCQSILPQAAASGLTPWPLANCRSNATSLTNSFPKSQPSPTQPYFSLEHLRLPTPHLFCCYTGLWSVPEGTDCYLHASRGPQFFTNTG